MSNALRRIALGTAGTTMVLAAFACAVGQDSGDALEGFSPVQALQIVDCLLPGQVRRVGGRTYQTPRRPARTTAEDCAARGGEYLVYDRADSASAINVWLPAAQEGDAEAQTMLGGIYERGVNGSPDYASAASWYRQAADQGYAPAQFNLGTLYEQGLGVPQDSLEALNWYRQASGLEEDSLIFSSAADAAQEELRNSLREQIEQQDRQIDSLRQQIETLNRQLEATAEASADIEANRQALVEIADRLAAERDAAIASLAELPEPVSAPAGTFEERERVEYRRRDFGQFFALIIGVQDYELLDDLISPANDSSEIGRVLEERYGFSIVRLADPDQIEIMRTINELNETLEEDDNLLIYFTGRGSRLSSGLIETGYWLPRNAEPSPNDTLWVPNEFVSRHLGRIEARRVLVIADASYAGLLGNEPGYLMVGEGAYSDAYIEWKMPKRSRLVLSSGEDEPVVETSGMQHSVFASALLETLNDNDQLLTAPELFLRVRRGVRSLIEVDDDVEEPALRALKDAGHEVGDFFLIPTQI